MLRFPAEMIEGVRATFERRRVVVTGGAGFIGGHLVDALVSLGARVRVIDDLSNSSAAALADLADLEPERVAVVHGSILDRDALADAFAFEPADPGNGASRPVLVFHLAAVGSVPLSIEQPARAWDVNATGTMRVLEALRAAGGGRIVFSSSSSIYGQGDPANGGDRSPCDESQPPRPLSPYAASKLAAEHLVETWSRTYGIDGVSLRYFNVFGPRQRADSAYAAVIPAFARTMLAGEAPVIFGDGEQTRDFTFVANVVAANLLAGAASGPPAGALANIGTGTATSLNELAGVLKGLVGGDAPHPRHADPRHGEVRHSLARIDRAADLLGYRPFVDLDAGLAETVGWHRAIVEAGADRSGLHPGGADR
ncbi:MAG: SDR family NAD(P)-dependent oxidoreductase [Planctomycetota bacterium]